MKTKQLIITILMITFVTMITTKVEATENDEQVEQTQNIENIEKDKQYNLTKEVKVKTLPLIFAIEKETIPSGNIRVTDIANKMNCTKPSVNKALNNLKEEKLINYETYGTIELTEDGESLAQKILEAYDIVYLFLKDVLNLDEESAKKMFEQTGVDAIMIARGTMGNPWIFKQILHYFETGEHLPKPSIEEVTQMILRHARMMLEFKGEYIGIREIRKHAAWYTAGYPNSARLRVAINNVESFEALEELLLGNLKETGNGAKP